MNDLIARALGKAALRRVESYREQQRRYNDMRLDALRTAGMVSVQKMEPININGPEIMTTPVLSLTASQADVEELCFEDMAALIGYYYPELVVDGPTLVERLTELVRSDNRLSRLRLKYGWHDAAKLLPNHSRHVLVWTQYGEYRAWYDHKWRCWRTRREGLRITHWREQCGPEDWPAAE